jgi:hypothetical protein
VPGDVQVEGSSALCMIDAVDSPRVISSLPGRHASALSAWCKHVVTAFPPPAASVGLTWNSNQGVIPASFLSGYGYTDFKFAARRDTRQSLSTQASSELQDMFPSTAKKVPLLSHEP